MLIYYYLIIIFFFLVAGHYFLTETLLEKMIETAAKTGIEGRIINVSSVVHGWVKKDGLSFGQMLNPNKYGPHLY